NRILRSTPLLHLAFETARQKKAANTANSCYYPRAPNVPTHHTAAYLFACIANASNKRLTYFKYPHKG
ncbi:hypothetical protein, partial [Paraburkholderia sp. SIMBA_054]|uniref:hypothetical protein n=1 Tax=Paraburkholderia sp. SIMBA_054 TaxID=3085795 RepID=UPI00397A660D